MRPTSPEDLDRITDYVAEELTPEEMAETERWIARDEGRRALVEYLRRSRASIGQQPARPIDLAAYVETVSERIRTGGAASHPVTLPRHPMGRVASPTLRHRAAVFVGAAVVVLAIVGAFLARPDRTADAVRHYRTVAGQRSTIRLTDGSTLTLAPETSVALTGREVDVTGAVYFDVAPSVTRPFIVRTQQAVVQVLGTRFVVRQYPDDEMSRVVVETGRVSVRPVRRLHGGAETILSSWMMAQVSDSGVDRVTDIEPRAFTSWTDGMLVFNYVALDEIVADLGRAYGVKIRVADSVLSKRMLRLDVSMKQQTLARVLDLIGIALDAHYTRVENVYVLFPGRLADRVPSNGPRSPQNPQLERVYGR